VKPFINLIININKIGKIIKDLFNLKSNLFYFSYYNNNNKIILIIIVLKDFEIKNSNI
jgi:hypothetical protein